MKKIKTRKIGRTIGCPLIVIQMESENIKPGHIEVFTGAIAEQMNTGLPFILPVPPGSSVRVTRSGSVKGVKSTLLPGGKYYEIKLYGDSKQAEAVKLDVSEASSLLGLDGNPLIRNG